MKFEELLEETRKLREELDSLKQQFEEHKHTIGGVRCYYSFEQTGGKNCSMSLPYIPKKVEEVKDES